jgi:predicted AAA+ superfamily ATPase
MNTNKLYPRFAAERLKEALADTPAVLIHGPRQSGKTTLARAVGEPLGYSYFSFDDLAMADAAKSDPIGFKDNFEVDIVMERGAHELAGVEVKASATVLDADFRGLRKLMDTAKNRFVAGVVLYDGDLAVSFGNNMFAIPIRLLWETT